MSQIYLKSFLEVQLQPEDKLPLYLQPSLYVILSVRRKQPGTGNYEQDGTNNRACACL